MVDDYTYPAGSNRHGGIYPGTNRIPTRTCDTQPDTTTGCTHPE